MNWTRPLLVLLLAQGAVAQTVDLPVGGDGVGGEPYPFGFASARMQTVYPLLPGSRVFGEIGLRRSSQPNQGPQAGYNAGIARSYRSLEIDLGDGDVRTFDDDFGSNRIGAMTTVFSRGIALPDATTSPGYPAPWANSYRFPFLRPYLHPGTKDLLVEMRVDGGTLINNNPWLGYSSYLMDAWSVPILTSARADFYSQTGCATQLKISGRVVNSSNGMVAEAYLNANILPNLPVVVGFGLTGVRQPGAGQPIAGSCQPLMMLPLWFSSRSTNTNGWFHSILYQGAPLPGLVGLPIFGQAAYTDPANSMFQLTNSVELRMPSPPDLTVRARSRYAQSATATRAIGVSYADTRGLRVQLR